MFRVSGLYPSQVGGWSQIAERGVRADGVVDSFPALELLVEVFGVFRFIFEETVEFVAVNWQALVPSEKRRCLVSIWTREPGDAL